MLNQSLKIPCHHVRLCPDAPFCLHDNGADSGKYLTGSVCVCVAKCVCVCLPAFVDRDGDERRGATPPSATGTEQPGDRDGLR